MNPSATVVTSRTYGSNYAIEREFGVFHCISVKPQL